MKDIFIMFKACVEETLLNLQPPNPSNKSQRCIAGTQEVYSRKAGNVFTFFIIKFSA